MPPDTLVQDMARELLELAGARCPITDVAELEAALTPAAQAAGLGEAPDGLDGLRESDGEPIEDMPDGRAVPDARPVLDFSFVLRDLDLFIEEVHRLSQWPVMVTEETPLPRRCQRCGDAVVHEDSAAGCGHPVVVLGCFPFIQAAVAHLDFPLLLELARSPAVVLLQPTAWVVPTAPADDMPDLSIDGGAARDG